MVLVAVLIASSAKCPEASIASERILANLPSIVEVASIVHPTKSICQLDIVNLNLVASAAEPKYIPSAL